MATISEIEVRVREDGVAWEDAETHCSFLVSSMREADGLAQTVADEEGKEVRWNYAGQTQGHYVQPRKASE